MLMPKRVKYRKQMRGRMKGKATRGTTVEFGDYGLQALEPSWVTARQIEAARRALVRSCAVVEKCGFASFPISLQQRSLGRRVWAAERETQITGSRWSDETECSSKSAE